MIRRTAASLRRGAEALGRFTKVSVFPVEKVAPEHTAGGGDAGGEGGVFARSNRANCAASGETRRT